MRINPSGEKAAEKLDEQNAPKQFNFAPLRDDFGRMLTAVGNKLEREWPKAYPADGQNEILQLVRMAVVYYATVAFVCSDVQDGAVRHPHLSLATPPLNRAILEIMASVLYLLEDVPAHIKEFFRAAWRDEQEMLVKYRARHSGKSRWDSYMAQRSAGVEKMGKALGITDAERSDLNQILRWPKMGKIIKRLKSRDPVPQVVSYLEFLDDWLYRDLSTQSHLEPKGLGEIGFHFLGMKELQIISHEDDIEKINERLDFKIQEFRTNQVWTAVTLILSLATEIDSHFTYGLKDKLTYYWSLFRENSETAQEFYDERYKALLS